MLDLAKAVMAHDEDKMKQATSLAVKRILNALLIFLVPVIVSISMDILEDMGVDYLTCYNVTTEQAREIKQIEDTKKAAEKEAKLRAIKEANEAAQAETERKIEARKILFAALNNLIHKNQRLTGSGCDGVVFYENGTFYRPANYYPNGTLATRGSGDYGYNIYFYTLLTRFVEDAKAEGYNFDMSRNDGDGAWRSLERQQYYWDLYKSGRGNPAANPGTSNHGWGIASDLHFSNDSDREWAHQNAKKYGLAFPYCNDLHSDCVEDWHIEPYSVSTNDEKVKPCI